MIYAVVTKFRKNVFPVIQYKMYGSIYAEFGTIQRRSAWLLHEKVIVKNLIQTPAVETSVTGASH